jgi:hypothetical protein
MQIKFFKTQKSFKKGGMHIHPEIYWGICLCLAFVIIITSIIFGFFLFQKINQTLTATGDNNKIPIPAISKERIDKALDYFSEREKKSAEILNSPAPVVDPSL